MAAVDSEILVSAREAARKDYYLAYIRAKQAGEDQFRVGGKPYGVDFTSQRLKETLALEWKKFLNVLEKAQHNPEQYTKQLAERAVELLAIMRVRASAGDMQQDDFFAKGNVVLKAVKAATSPQRNRIQAAESIRAIRRLIVEMIRPAALRESLVSTFQPANYGYWVEETGEIKRVQTVQGHDDTLGSAYSSAEDRPFWVEMALEQGWIRVIAPLRDNREMAIDFDPAAVSPAAARTMIDLIRGLQEYRSYQVNHESFPDGRSAIRVLRDFVAKHGPVPAA